MKIYYTSKEFYEESHMPRACFEHGDRTCYILSDKSREELSEKLNINLWSEYDATINFFKDGTANLMKMEYSYSYEEFQEEEVYVFNEDEIKEIKIILE